MMYPFSLSPTATYSFCATQRAVIAQISAARWSWFSTLRRSRSMFCWGRSRASNPVIWLSARGAGRGVSGPSNCSKYTSDRVPAFGIADSGSITPRNAVGKASTRHRSWIRAAWAEWFRTCMSTSILATRLALWLSLRPLPDDACPGFPMYCPIFRVRILSAMRYSPISSSAPRIGASRAAHVICFSLPINSARTAAWLPESVGTFLTAICTDVLSQESIQIPVVLFFLENPISTPST